MNFGYEHKITTMENILYLLVVAFLFSACSSVNKILVINDGFKEEKNIKLIQHLDGFSDEKKGLIFDGPDYIFTVKMVYTKPLDNSGSVNMEFSLTTSARPDELDSVIYLLVDGTKFKLVSNDFSMVNYVDRSTSASTTTTSEKDNEKGNSSKDEKSEKIKTSVTTTTSVTDKSLQAMKHNFEISPKLWDQLIRCDKLMIRAYIESEGVDVLFNYNERNKFAGFFYEVQKNEAAWL